MRIKLHEAIVVLLLVLGGMYVFLNREMRGPRGYYVQEDDPKVFVEFFVKPKVRSNIAKEYGVREYRFTAYDTDMDLYGPTDISTPKRWTISGDGDVIGLDGRRFVKTKKK